MKYEGQGTLVGPDESVVSPTNYPGNVENNKRGLCRAIEIGKQHFQAGVLILYFFVISDLFYLHPLQVICDCESLSQVPVCFQCIPISQCAVSQCADAAVA